MSHGEIVYVHDEEIWDSGNTFGRHTIPGTAKVHHLACDKNESVEYIVDKVTRVLKGAPLKTLIFNGHGNCGAIFVGEHITKPKYIKLKPLRPYFLAAPGGGSIEIHSCHFLASGNVNERIYYLALGQRTAANFGSWTSMDEHGDKARTAIQKSGAGEECAKKLAAITGARVKASYMAQTTDKVGKFEGLWGCAWPDGTFKRYPARIRPDRVV